LKHSDYFPGANYLIEIPEKIVMGLLLANSRMVELTNGKSAIDIARGYCHLF